MTDKSHTTLTGNSDPVQIDSGTARAGVMGKPPTGLADDEAEVIKAYRSLNGYGRQELRSCLWIMMREKQFL